MFQTKVVEKIKTHFMSNNLIFFSNIVLFFRYVETYGITGQATDDNMSLGAFHAGKLSLQTRTRNGLYNYGYTNVP